MYNTDLADMRTITEFLNKELDENIDKLDLYNKDRALKMAKDTLGVMVSCVEEGDHDIISYMNVHKRLRDKENTVNAVAVANSI